MRRIVAYPPGMACCSATTVALMYCKVCQQPDHLRTFPIGEDSYRKMGSDLKEGTIVATLI